MCHKHRLPVCLRPWRKQQAPEHCVGPAAEVLLGKLSNRGSGVVVPGMQQAPLQLTCLTLRPRMAGTPFASPANQEPPFPATDHRRTSPPEGVITPNPSAQPHVMPRQVPPTA